jgi:hypothetical protein
MQSIDTTQTDAQSASTAFPPAQPAYETANALSDEPQDYPQWLWLAAGVVILLLGAIGGLFFWRRSNERFVPVIEPPIVAGQGDGAGSTAEDIKVDLDVEVIRLSRSLMTLTLNCRVSAANRSDRAVRNLDIWADLTSAHRSVPVEQQMAMPDTVLPQLAKIERIGPHQSHYEQLSLQIPVAELNGFRQGNAALCVPILRLRIGAPRMDAKTRSYAIGLDSGGAAPRLQALPLHVPPGSYPAVRLRALN